MERATVVKTFNGSLSQKTYNRRERDASFSSYLRPDEPINEQQEHLANGGCTIVDEISIFDAHKYFNESSNIETQKVSCNNRVSPVVDHHVNVVKLQRNSERCDLSVVPSRFSSASSSFDGYMINSRNYRARSFHAATPTASSEASWNSQIGLLSNPPGAIPVSMRPNSHHKDKKIKGCTSTTARWLFRRKCPCTGKKSVQVDDTQQPAATYSLTPKPVEKITRMKMEKKADAKSTWGQGNSISHIGFPSNLQPQQTVAVLASGSARAAPPGFTFPILNPSSSSSPVLKGIIEDMPRHSLEVFRPPSSPKPGRISEEEIASDASSDLFEIESFSTQTNHNRDSLDYSRQSLDEPITPSRINITLNDIAQTDRCYEPSEASIDWSVTTAEGFDRASVTNMSVTASEFADEIHDHDHDHTMMIIRGRGDHHHHHYHHQPERSKRRSLSSPTNGLLLSCRCEKAVSVGPKPVKCVSADEGHREREGPSVVSVNSTLRHVGSRAHLVNKPPLARSHSSRVSLPFATLRHRE